jgi:hypothetical protein
MISPDTPGTVLAQRVLDDPVLRAAVEANVATAPPLTREQIELVNRVFRPARPTPKGEPA